MHFSEEFDPATQTWTVRRLRGTPGNHEVRPWVTVEPSRIPNAGDGVFADRNFKVNRVIGYYTGAYSLHRESSCEYAYEINGFGRVIDAAKCGNWTRKINDGCHRRRKPVCNVEFGPDNQIVTTRYIRKGEELFIDYGPDYWN